MFDDFDAQVQIEEMEDDYLAFSEIKILIWFFQKFML